MGIEAGFVMPARGFPNGCRYLLPFQGVVLADHARSLDWRARRAAFICATPAEVVDDVVAKMQALITGED